MNVKYQHISRRLGVLLFGENSNRGVDKKLLIDKTLWHIWHDEILKWWTWWTWTRTNLHNSLGSSKSLEGTSKFDASEVWQEAWALLLTHTNGARDSFTPGLTGTSRSSMWPEKLIDLVEKSSVFCGSRRVVTSLSTVRHWQVFWSRWIMSPADRTLSLHCIFFYYILTCTFIWWSSFPFMSSYQCVLRMIGAVRDYCDTPTSSSFVLKTYKPRHCFIIFSVRSDVSLTWGCKGGKWPCRTARLLRSWVRIPPGAWIFVCCECRVLSGRGLCDCVKLHLVGCTNILELKTWLLTDDLHPSLCTPLSQRNAMPQDISLCQAVPTGQ